MSIFLLDLRVAGRLLICGSASSMSLMFAILFGGLVAPETAHADNLLAGHSVEVLDKHDHADDDNQEDPELEGGSPCHALVHHCGVALATDSESASLTIWDGGGDHAAIRSADVFACSRSADGAFAA